MVACSLRGQGLAITAVFLSIIVTLLFSIFSLQSDNVAFSKQLLLCATCSLLIGLGIFAFLIIRLLVQNAKVRGEKLDYEEV